MIILFEFVFPSPLSVQDQAVDPAFVIRYPLIVSSQMKIRWALISSAPLVVPMQKYCITRAGSTFLLRYKCELSNTI